VSNFKPIFAAVHNVFLASMAITTDGVSQQRFAESVYNQSPGPSNLRPVFFAPFLGVTKKTGAVPSAQINLWSVNKLRLGFF
jgi:hypothetical protein